MLLASSATAQSVSPRPRLLALHGWRTSATILQQQLKISGLATTLAEVADVIFLDAPHSARGPPTPDVKRFFEPPFYEWWDAVQHPDGGPVVYEGVEQSLAVLEAAAAAGRPVSGLLGFSQGAALAALVAALQERGETFQNVPPLRCVLLVAGSMVRDAAYVHMYDIHNSSSSLMLLSQPPLPSPVPGGGHLVGCPPRQKQQQQQKNQQESKEKQEENQQRQPHHHHYKQHHRAQQQAFEVQQQSATGSGPPSPQLQQPPPPSPTAPLPRLFRTPSCHLVGAADPGRGRSEALAKCFGEPLVLRHEQGHVVPRLAPQQRQQLVAFLATHLGNTRKQDELQPERA